MLRKNTPDFVRRKLLAMGGSLAITPVVGFAGSRNPNFTVTGESSASTGSASHNALSNERIHEALLALCETLFGHRFTEEDRKELEWRIEYLVREAPQWRTSFEQLATYLNTKTGEGGYATFARAADEAKIASLEAMMSHSEQGLGSRLIAALFDTERQLRSDLLLPAIRRIESLYLKSGIPWRRRGYGSWPGVPGDTFEYTRPGQTTDDDSWRV